MREFNWKWGSLDRRQLHVRMFIPFRMCEWSPKGSWHFNPRRLISPRAWWKCIFSKWNWGWSLTRRNESTHRCYCPEGRSFDGRIQLAGWCVVWWYSHYRGKVPCACDLAWDEFKVEEYGDEPEYEETVLKLAAPTAPESERAKA